MLKRSVLVLITIVLCLSGCSQPDRPSEDGAITFTDDLSREVTVNQPQRVASLLGSFADVWYLAGGEIIAAPDDAWEDLELPLSEDAKDLGNTKDLSLETLFSADPDFIIASAKTRVDLDWEENLESANIPVAYFSVANFDDYLRMLKICTDITGRADLFEKNGASIQKQIDEIKQQSKTRVEEHGVPTVLSLRASASSIRAKNSHGNVLGEMLRDLGCKNIADNDETILENLSIEHIMASDPDYIFIVQNGDDVEGMKKNIDQFIAENPAWNQLTAVKEGRVFLMAKRLFNLKPNALWGEAYRQLEEIFQKHEI